MNTSPLSTVVGVFPGNGQAESAIDGLRHAGFGYDRIRMVERGTGSFMDTLKGMFTGQASTTSNAADGLIKMGMPDYEAQHYQNELDANHVLLLMNASDHPEEALGIMRQSGAFDLNLRLRMTPEDNVPEDNASEQSTVNHVSGTPAPVHPVAAPYPGFTAPPYNGRAQRAVNPAAQPFTGTPNTPPPPPDVDEAEASDDVDTSIAPEARV